MTLINFIKYNLLGHDLNENKIIYLRVYCLFFSIRPEIKMSLLKRQIKNEIFL